MDEPASNAGNTPAGGPVPKAVASRLSLYLRELQHLIEQGEEHPLQLQPTRHEAGFY